MIIGLICLGILLIGLCGAVAFLCLRSWNLIDAIKSDIANHAGHVRILEQIATAARDAWREMETTHYSKLASKFAALEGTVEGWEHKQKIFNTSLDQMHTKLASWQRTEGRNAKNEAKPAPDIVTPGSEHATLEQLIAEGKAIPFASSNGQTPVGKSLRNRHG